MKMSEETAINFHERLAVGWERRYAGRSFAAREALLRNCLGKVKYYLQNDSIRKTVALNGFRKALGAPYTYEAQLEHVLDKIVY
jgi:hypothetical protein